MLGEEVRKNEVETLLLEELRSPVCFELLIPLILRFRISCVLSGRWGARSLFFIIASLANFSRCAVGSDDLLLDEHDALALVTCLARLHDGDDDLLLVDLLVQTGVFEDLRPVDTFVRLLS